MLQVDIRKQLNAFELQVQFQAEKEVLGLLGPSGCGKSMTLKCIAGIEKPDSGRIELDGIALYDSTLGINLPPQQRKVGYLFQQYALFPAMSVEGNLLAGVRSEEKYQARQLVAEIVHSMNLGGLEKKKPHQLSGGQKQRVALARILLNRPQILMLDEPFSALDQYLKWQVQIELKDLFDTWPGTVLLVSHNRDEIFQLCDAVSVLRLGKNETKQTASELFHHPQTLTACMLAGCKNFSRIKASESDQNKLMAIDWEVTLHSQPVSSAHQYCGVYSHAVLPYLGSGFAQSEHLLENIFPVELLYCFESLSSWMVVCSSPGGSGVDARLTLKLSKEQWFKWRDLKEKYIIIPPENLMLLEA
ncbi:MAG: ATP-binding cassette domain-containing protein [Anaerolineaceae bacterium]|nr:ATP-binding cassette domain-containing protein [Anaerolineaceae bacterium]